MAGIRIRTGVMQDGDGLAQHAIPVEPINPGAEIGWRDWAEIPPTPAPPDPSA